MCTDSDLELVVMATVAVFVGRLDAVSSLCSGVGAARQAVAHGGVAANPWGNAMHGEWGA